MLASSLMVMKHLHNLTCHGMPYGMHLVIMRPSLYLACLQLQLQASMLPLYEGTYTLRSACSLLAKSVLHVSKYPEMPSMTLRLSATWRGTEQPQVHKEFYSATD